MIYYIPCECGNHIDATPVQAGTTITCDCGRKHEIPMLSEMRRIIGRSGSEARIVHTIHRMIRAGELPWGHKCCVSRMPTQDVCTLCIQYEFAGTGQAEVASELFLGCLFILLPFGKIFQAMVPENTRNRAFDRDRSVKVPLLVDKKYHDQVRGTWSQRKLRRWLRTVPVYEQLLREYPHAKVSYAEGE